MWDRDGDDGHGSESYPSSERWQRGYLGKGQVRRLKGFSSPQRIMPSSDVLFFAAKVVMFWKQK
jgi:hypothetical protein